MKKKQPSEKERSFSPRKSFVKFKDISEELNKMTSSQKNLRYSVQFRFNKYQKGWMKRGIKEANPVPLYIKKRGSSKNRSKSNLIIVSKR